MMETLVVNRIKPFLLHNALKYVSKSEMKKKQVVIQFLELMEYNVTRSMLLFIIF